MATRRYRLLASFSGGTPPGSIVEPGGRFSVAELEGFVVKGYAEVVPAKSARRTAALEGGSEHAAETSRAPRRRRARTKK